MNLKAGITLSFLITGTIGCTPFVRLIKQVNPPAFESSEAVLAYMQQNNIGLANTFRADSSLLVPFNRAFIVLPNALVFNSNNELVDIGYPGVGKVGKENPNACAPEFETVVKQLCSGANYPIAEKPKADGLLKHMYDFEGKSALEVVDKDYDYLVIISWATFLGKFNNKVLTWEKELQTIEGCKIKVLKLNTDPQPAWGNNWSGLKDPVFSHLKK